MSAGPIEELRKEHQVLLADAKDLEAAVRALSGDGNASWTEVGGSLRERLEIFHRSLRLHFRREEEGLFPDVQEMVSQRSQRSDVMVQFFAQEGEDDMNAHVVLSMRTEDMLSLIDEIQAAGTVNRQSLARLRTLANLTRSLLERHAEKEDRLIFPMVERALDQLQLEEVAKRLSALGSAADLLDSTTQEPGDAPSGRDEDLSDLSMGDE